MTGPLRYFIDSLVLIIAVLWLVPLTANFFGSDVDGVTPEETLVLDERILEEVDDFTVDFIRELQTPKPQDVYHFTYGTPDAPVRSDAELYKKAVQSMVYLYIVGEFGDYMGSGSVVTEDGVIMTNHHNIAEATKIAAVTHDGVIHEVQSVLAYNEALDVAFIKINAHDLVPIPLGRALEQEVGDRVVAIGHPEGFINTLSTGVISGIRDFGARGFGTQLQTTAPISAGNSGGVLLNARGHVIGIPSASVEYTDNAVQVQNINFAVSVDDALSVLGIEQ